MNTKDLLNGEYGVEKTYLHIEQITRVQEHLNDLGLAHKAYFMTGDESFLKTFNNISTALDSSFKKLKTIKDDSQIQTKNCDTLYLLINQRNDFYSRSIELQQRKGANEKLHREFFEKGYDVDYKLKRIFTNMLNEEGTELKNKTIASDTRSNFAMYTLSGGSTIVLLLLGFASYQLYKSNIRTIDENSQVLTREELEVIVRDRTAEISKINQRLNQEISKHEVYEQALKKSAENYQSLYEQAHDAIVIFEPETENVINCNKRACDLYGIKKEDFIGMSFKNLSKNVKEGNRNIEITLNKGYYHNFQTVHYKKDGTEMLMEINASVFMYKGNKTILSINRDITDRVLRII